MSTDPTRKDNDEDESDWRHRGIRRRAAKAVPIVCGGHFLSHFYYLTPLLMLPSIRETLSTNFTTLGVALAGYGLMTALMQVPVGFAVDRFGAPLILAAGLGLSGSAFALAGFSPSLPVFATAMLLLGLGDSVFHSTNYAIISSVVPPEVAGRAYALHNFSGQFGFFVAPIVISLAASFVDWQGIFIAAGSIGLAGALVIVALRTRLVPDVRVEAVGRATSIRSQSRGWQLLLSRPLIVSLVIFVGIGVTVAGVREFGTTTLGILYPDLAQYVGPIVSTYLGVSLCGVLAGGWLADRTGQTRIIAAGSLGAIACILVMIGQLAPSWPWLFVLFATMGGAAGMISASRDLLVRSFVPAQHVGKAFGFVSLGISIASLIGPILYGWLLDGAWPDATFYVAAGVALATLILVLLARSKPAANAGHA